MSPLAGALLRFFATAQENGKVRTYLRASWTVFLQASGVLGASTIILSLALWVSGQTQWLGLFIAATVFSLFSGGNGMLDAIQIAARRRAVVAGHQGVGQWFRFLLAVALISLLGSFSSVAMWGYAAASALVLGSQLLVFRATILPMDSAQCEPHSSDIAETVTRFWRYGWPLSTWGIFTWAQMASERWALEAFRPTSEVGLYQALYQVGYYPILLASGMVTQLISPILYARAGDCTDLDRLRATLRLNRYIVACSLLLTLIGTILSVFLHNQIFSLFTNKDYKTISMFLPAMVLSGGLFAAGQIAAISLLTSETTKLLIKPKIATAVIGMALDWIGAYYWGLKGIVFAGIIFSAIYLLWVLHLAGDHRRLTTNQLLA